MTATANDTTAPAVAADGADVVTSPVAGEQVRDRARSHDASTVSTRRSWSDGAADPVARGEVTA